MTMKRTKWMLKGRKTGLKRRTTGFILYVLPIECSIVYRIFVLLVVFAGKSCAGGLNNVDCLVFARVAHPQLLAVSPSESLRCRFAPPFLHHPSLSFAIFYSSRRHASGPAPPHSSSLAFVLIDELHPHSPVHSSIHSECPFHQQKAQAASAIQCLLSLRVSVRPGRSDSRVYRHRGHARARRASPSPPSQPPSRVSTHSLLGLYKRWCSHSSSGGRGRFHTVIYPPTVLCNLERSPTT